MYGSESESSDESDEELHTSSHKQSKQDSDEAIRVNHIYIILISYLNNKFSTIN